METLLLALPYYICSVAALGTTLIVAVSVQRRMYPRRILLLGAGMLCLGMSFFLIAATAAPNGHAARAAMAAPIRVLDTTGGLLWLLWLALAVKSAVRVEKRHPAGD
jgi:predicted transporter